MRFRLLRRRLTISAPRMAVRSALPWPLRWAVLAVVFGFCSAIALWAFEFGKSIAGLDAGAGQELIALRAEVRALREERDRAQSVLNTSDSLIAAEKAAKESLAVRLRQVEADNRALRDDLGFFEQLIPASGSEGVAIRGVQAEVLGDSQAGGQLKWQLLVIQAVKNAPEFNGRLEFTLMGTEHGKAWQMGLPGGSQPLRFRQYTRVEGMLDLPPTVLVKTVTAKVMEGAAVRAVHTVKL